MLSRSRSAPSTGRLEMYLNTICALSHEMSLTDTKKHAPTWRTDAEIEEIPEYEGDFHVGHSAVRRKQTEETEREQEHADGFHVVRYDPAVAAARRKRTEEVDRGWEHVDPPKPGLHEMPKVQPPVQVEEDTTDQCIRALQTQMEKIVQIVTDMTTDKQSTDEGTRARMETIETDIYTLRQHNGSLRNRVAALEENSARVYANDRETNERLTEFETFTNGRLYALENPKKEEPKKKNRWLPSFRSHAHMDYANSAFGPPVGAGATPRARRLHAREYELY